MKRLLNLRNRVAVPSVFAGLLFAASSFTFAPGEDAQLAGDPPQKKVQRVTVIVNKDGKETKIDTTFNLADGKMVHSRVDSVLRKLDIGDFDHGNPDVIIHRGGKPMKGMAINGRKAPGDEQFEIFIQNSDSGKTKGVRKMIHVNGLEHRFQAGNMGNESPLPPPPPMPPHVIRMHKQFGGDPYAFDTRDESVISYEKKDIGGGLERITIVRKKLEEHPKKKEIRNR